MTLKSLIIPLAAIVLSGIVACDKIDDKDRVKPISTNGGGGDTHSNRVVLVEDYTGQKCINCPPFGARINNFAKKYPNRVIPVAVHCGILAYSESDFTTAAGEAYAQWLGLNAVPAGVVDRQIAPNGNPIVFQDFNKMVPAIEAALNKPERLALFPKAMFNADSTRILTSILATPTGAMGKDIPKMKVQLWLLEDGVVAKQYLPNGSTNDNFVHNHLLRAALNGTWGEDFAANQLYRSDGQLPTTIRDKKKLYLVAFVYDQSNRSVIETVQMKIN